MRWSSSITRGCTGGLPAAPGSGAFRCSTYVPPQLWAWAGWRVKKVQRTVDLVLCSLPFEPDWYKARGYNQAEYVGHPYFDELAERELDEAFLARVRDNAHLGPLVAILPGSRTQELTRNLPIMIRAAVKLAQATSRDPVRRGLPARAPPGARRADHPGERCQAARQLHRGSRSSRRVPPS